MNILTIDDDTHFSAAVKLTVESKGHQVTATHNWLSFMHELENNEFDAIIADVETPTGNGLNAMAFLNAEEAVRNVPKVFVTGRDDAETVRRCYELDALYLHKSPSVFDEIKEFLKTIPERNHADSVTV